MVSIWAIIQVRTTSKRLPNKAILKIGDKRIIEIIIQRLKKSTCLDGIVLATTRNKSDDILEEIARSNEIEVYRGSEYNVLDRFYRTIKQFNIDVAVRVTGDNPLTHVGILEKNVKVLINKNLDYVSMRNLICGLGSEAILSSAIEKAWRNASKLYELEHVTPYIYEHPSEFRIKYLDPPQKYARKDIRLTIDTKEDYKLFLEIYRELGDLTQIAVDKVIELLDKKPYLKRINCSVEQRDYRHAELY